MVSLFNLVFLSVVTAEETARTAEAILLERTPTIIPYSPNKQKAQQTSRTAEQIFNSSKSTQKQTLSTSTSSPLVNQKPTHPTNTSRTISGLKIEVQRCKSVPEYKSITCDMTLTNQSNDSDAVLYCYTGTMAKDESGNNLQCAHIWLGSNHSWNFAQGKLPKGKPVKGMVRLETKKPISKIRELIISINFEGTRQSILVKNIPVQ